MYYDSLPRNLKYDYVRMLNITRISECTTNTDLVMRLAAISELLKIKGDEISPAWRYYHGIHGMCEYYDVAPEGTTNEKVREWLEKDVDLHLNGSRVQWHSAFKRAIDQIFDEEFDMMSALGGAMSSKKYSEAYIWMKGVSTDLEGANVFHSKLRRVKKTRRTKKSASLAVQPEEIVRKLYQHSPQQLRIFQKPDAQKRRFIANGDFDNFLKMDFISCFLDKGFEQHQHMSVLNNMSKRREMFKSLIDHGKDEKYIKLPLDQSKFDHMVTREMLEIIFDKITDICPRGSEQQDVARILRQSMFSLESTVYNGTDSFRYCKGVASGWRWTALLDTIINYAEFIIIKAEYDKRTARYCRHQIEIISMNFQGDDARLVLNCSIACAEALMAMYSECGLKVNKQKNFISRNRDEFLKMVAEGDNLVGYPARVIMSMTQYKPVSDAPMNFVDRINDITNNALRGARRGMSLDFIKHYLATVVRSKKVNYNDYMCWLITPNSVGGYGLAKGDTLRTLLDIKEDRWVRLRATTIEYTNRVCEIQFDVKVETAERDHVIDARLLKNAVMSILPQADRGLEVLERSRFETIDKIERRSNYNVMKDQYMYELSARYKKNEKYHPVIYESIIATAIANEDQDCLMEFLEDESLEQYRAMVRNKHTKRIITEWLSGKITVAMAQSVDYDALMNEYVRKECELELLRQLNQREMSHNIYIQIQLAIECEVHSMINNYIRLNRFRILN
jgi:hypothetical protein